jgi:signal transduction histidine kinase
MLGVPEGEELVGRNVLDNVIEDEHRRLAANYSNVLVAGTRKNTEYTVRRRDGTTVPAEASSAVICDAAGKPKAVMAVIRDISARKKAEEALQKEQRTLEHMLHASDHERQLIAYDIHDGLAQQLAGAIMQFQVYDHLKGADPEEAQRAYLGGTTLLRQAHLEARRLISGVRPPVLDESGIVAGVAHLIDDRGLAGGPKVEFHSKVRFRRLAAVLENVIYRIVQEGLGNALRHSQSKQVRVGLLQRGDPLLVCPGNVDPLAELLDFRQRGGDHRLAGRHV